MWCIMPSIFTPLSQSTLLLVNCSNCGFSFDACRLKSSTVPILKMLIPGNLLLLLYIKLPQIEQKLSSIVAPEAIVLFCAHLDNLSSPRMCFRVLSLTVKFEQNIEELSLWQSLQLHTNVLMRPSPSTGCSKCECKRMHAMEGS